MVLSMGSVYTVHLLQYVLYKNILAVLIVRHMTYAKEARKVE